VAARRHDAARRKRSEGPRFERFLVHASDAALAERAAAEAFDAGASGLEERGGAETDGVTELRLYAPAAAAAAVWEALADAERAAPGALRLVAREPVPDEDWSEGWRRGLGIVRISERLAVRPPFVPDPPGAAPALVIDPAQAFGTGGHASTRIALVLLDGLGESALRGARVLDAGTGSGVLALASLALGASGAVGFDLDPVAVREARANARRNALGASARFFVGPIAALRTEPFDLVLANLLRTELLPLLPALAASLRPGGRAVLSGLLRGERGDVEAALRRAGLRVEASLEEADPSGDDWLGFVTRR
jgi:ribosomal protein L11 methyltransferase